MGVLIGGGIIIKEKILMVFTGGTIQSDIKNNSIDVSDNNKYLLLDMYNKQENKKEIEFDIISPISILSENATVEDWTAIVNSIKEKELLKYKGIIITYGTDTLGYFANALSYLLYDIEIPVMIVSDNFVLTDKRSNGLDNFSTAVNFIIQKNYNGVFVSFKNYNGQIYIHKGTRVKQIAQLATSVYSIYDDYFAQVIDGEIIEKKKDNIEYVQEGKYKFNIGKDVLYIKPVVGMKYNFMLDGYRAVFHESFHTNAIPKDAINLVKECNERGILFFIGTMFDEGRTLYKETSEAVKEGAIIIQNMSLEAIISKLMIATGTFNTNEEIKEFMSKNIIGEFITL